MRTFDLSPLFRSTIGVDRVSRLLDSALQYDGTAGSFPPYNIEKTGENSYRIVMAVAGFGEDDLEITTAEGGLVVKGKGKAEENGHYLHRGIAARAFERRFQLADFIKVTGATLANGMLSVDLVREVPEAQKPRTVAIQSVAGRALPNVEQPQAQAA
jgi:molecular chaperone IbpA